MVTKKFSDQEKISIALLVYNEGESIEHTVRQAITDLDTLNINYELWVFDNRSTDGTEHIIWRLQKELPRLNYYRQPENVGYAFSTLSSIKEPDADIYVTIDGDGQYRLTDVRQLIDQIHKGADAVYAVRSKRQDSFGRLVISSVFNKIGKILLKTQIRDLNCGFRALNKRAAKAIHIRNKITYVGPEIYVRLVQLKMKVTDVEVSHFVRAGGQSVFSSPAAIAVGVYKMIMYLWTLRKELDSSAPLSGVLPPKGEIFKNPNSNDFLQVA